MKTKLITGRIRIPLLLALVFCGHQELAAQVPVDENGEPLATYDDGAYSDLGIAGAEVEDILPTTDVDLEELVGPIALYPDDLLAIVLPASTYPLEIVQAARFLTAFEADSSLLPDESWDESIVALLNYPEVVRLMDDEIDWTWQLGEAVLSQEADVIAAVEAFRDRAYAAGNLASDEYQTVSREDGVIEIEPLDDEIIYVPYYEPSKVVTYQTQPVYAYYPDPYPVYYYPYPTGHYFLHRPFWGVTTAYTIGWPNRYLNVHHSSYWGHPYYGSYYSSQYYRQPSSTSTTPGMFTIVTDSRSTSIAMATTGARIIGRTVHAPRVRVFETIITRLAVTTSVVSIRNQITDREMTHRPRTGLQASDTLQPPAAIRGPRRRRTATADHSERQPSRPRSGFGNDPAPM